MRLVCEYRTLTRHQAGVPLLQWRCRLHLMMHQHALVMCSAGQGSYHGCPALRKVCSQRHLQEKRTRHERLNSTCVQDTNCMCKVSNERLWHKAWREQYMSTKQDSAHVA